MAAEQARFSNPATLPPTPGYSQVVEVVAGRIIYISGQVAQDAEGNLVGIGDLRAQIEQVFANLQAALESVGASFANVVKLTIFMLDATQVAVLREIRNRYVNTQAPPASSLVEVRRLSRAEFLVEIEAIANLPA